MTYQEVYQLTQGRTLPLCGQNVDGENIIIERGDGFLKLTTAQHNGWTRLNILFADGSSEEYYRK